MPSPQFRNPKALKTECSEPGHLQCMCEATDVSQLSTSYKRQGCSLIRTHYLSYCVTLAFLHCQNVRKLQTTPMDNSNIICAVYLPPLV